MVLDDSRNDEASWDQAPSIRTRDREKRRETVDHRALLGDEPLLRPEDRADAGARSDVEESDELVPETVARRLVRKPGREEVEKHALTHVPYRSWCDLCVLV